jgi:hypothetical protein
MRVRRGVVSLTAALAMLAPTAAWGGGDGDPTSTPQPYFGIDHLVHEPAPAVVHGVDNNEFSGIDLDIACHYGAKMGRQVRTLAKVVRLIRASGRRVIWTIGPNKTNVMTDLLPAALPQGRCDTKGIKKQDAILDGFDDPSYLPMRKPLARDKRQMFWRTDPHWTTVAASVYAVRVAHELDRKLAKRQKYTYGTETRVGLFTKILGQDTLETLATAHPTTPVAVRTAPGSTEDFAGYPELVWDHSWVSSPARRTWRGHTLVLGDSFALFALDSLRPLFHHGRWMWVNGVPVESLIDGIVEADTVVLEVQQNFLYLDQPVLKRSFRAQLRKALKSG